MSPRKGTQTAAVSPFFGRVGWTKPQPTWYNFEWEMRLSDLQGLLQTRISVTLPPFSWSCSVERNDNKKKHNPPKVKLPTYKMAITPNLCHYEKVSFPKWNKGLAVEQVQVLLDSSLVPLCCETLLKDSKQFQCHLNEKFYELNTKILFMYCTFPYFQYILSWNSLTDILGLWKKLIPLK